MNKNLLQFDKLRENLYEKDIKKTYPEVRKITKFTYLFGEKYIYKKNILFESRKLDF